jgi:hypothetical protein
MVRDKALSKKQPFPKKSLSGGLQKPWKKRKKMMKKK